MIFDLDDVIVYRCTTSGKGTAPGAGSTCGYISVGNLAHKPADAPWRVYGCGLGDGWGEASRINGFGSGIAQMAAEQEVFIAHCFDHREVG